MIREYYSCLFSFGYGEKQLENFLCPDLVVSNQTIYADKFKSLASKYDVSGYPTLKFFSNDFPTDYSDPCKADLLVPYLKKNVALDVFFLHSNAEVNEFIKASDKKFPYLLVLAWKNPWWSILGSSTSKELGSQ